MTKIFDNHVSASLSYWIIITNVFLLFKKCPLFINIFLVISGSFYIDIYILYIYNIHTKIRVLFDIIYEISLKDIILLKENYNPREIIEILRRDKHVHCMWVIVG